jgi:DNA adenine methylase
MTPQTIIDIKPGKVSFRSADVKSEALSHEIKRPDTLPFLKWAGGKQWLARIMHLIKPTLLGGTYYEPFLGGGSVFFSLSPSRAVISDLNKELVITYRAIAHDVEAVIAELKSYPHTKAFYNAIRSSRPVERYERAARFIYLNKTAWNGLYRVNLRGEFNVPFGKYENVTLCPEERLRDASVALEGASVCYCDFETVTKKAVAGDLVYFDPPYITTHNNNGFLKYNAKLFSWKDQLRLARIAQRLRVEGVHVVISNADHKPLIDLYGGFYCHQVQRNSLISGGLESRRRTSEVLLTSFQLSPASEVNYGHP